MTDNIHTFQIALEWIGNLGKGTSSYDNYSREHVVKYNAKDDIILSSLPEYKGNNSFHNPEELFVSSLASCHMLWYLHLCADAGICVEEYEDNAEGILEIQNDGSGKFKSIELHPIVTIKNKEKKQQAIELHHKAHKMCFIANSCNFPITYNAQIS